MGHILYYTKSVCPDCLRPVTAAVTAEPDGIYMRKTCPGHGESAALIWADSEENYLQWLRCGALDAAALPQSEAEAESLFAGRGFGCPARCQSVSSALMTTNRCNLDCPVCFTRERGEALCEPSLEECRALLLRYREKAGPDALLELCGGEPTVRGDILDLAAMARDMGFDFIQLNTNGIRLAADAGFCVRLRESGVTTVYMGFDGVTETPYLAKYGRPMLAAKLAAVENAAAAGLAVVLVVCVIPGENDGQLGDIVSFAKEHMPAVKGVFFQPISYFGIYPKDNIRRITIPDVIRALAAQNPELHAADFGPGAYEHPQCSFQSCYLLGKDALLHPLSKLSQRTRGDGDWHRLRAAVRTTWLPGERKLLTVGGMAFQDCSNIDLGRTERCSIQIIGRDGAMYPLCSKYLSGCGGGRALPGIS